ncbi:hypothetical protein KKI90_16880 [Xenorhabdus bovienii]|uniref:hypothetical protein n=1 Tax=Xenorhabdus bovienii TaxID=40576 RepID=UPI00237C6B71|nr:hypothetical protein [Xenorhabdus bovienii]MDE1487978.1 hypothetical protein [Xenorhabdus bovienii]MDE9457912.1 hypothetical protein [Xenorhabdus bovienii]MDE9477760.1 hypothetical protein [Xenorhabdus bovienii]MDE9513978.1 hypothetical protein [Xenorhabdus bovienii]MDE9530615.1 hypothetical protein [Xenorhabdus bovienii]
MGNGVSNEFYSDFKRVLKLIFKVFIALIAIAVVVSVIYWANSEFQQSSKENEVLDKALPFTKDHKPWTYTRNDFGKESRLELWFLGDTDSHAIIKVAGKYSVYSTTSRGGVISFNRKAGDACNYYASAAYNDKRIISVDCDNKSYEDGPWNVVK